MNLGFFLYPAALSAEIFFIDIIIIYLMLECGQGREFFSLSPPSGLLHDVHLQLAMHDLVDRIGAEIAPAAIDVRHAIIRPATGDVTTLGLADIAAAVEKTLIDQFFQSAFHCIHLLPSLVASVPPDIGSFLGRGESDNRVRIAWTICRAR